MPSRSAVVAMATRRETLAQVLLGGAALVLSAGVPETAIAGAAEPREDTARTPADFMALAFAMRRQATEAGDQPYGAVVVLDGRVVAAAPSAVVAKADPAAHAETEAIGRALSVLGPQGMAGAVLYSSSRPCPVCEGNARRAGIARMIHGAALTDAGPPQASRP